MGEWRREIIVQGLAGGGSSFKEVCEREGGRCGNGERRVEDVEEMVIGGRVWMCRGRGVDRWLWKVWKVRMGA